LKRWSKDSGLTQALLEPHLQKAYGDLIYLCGFNRSTEFVGGQRNHYAIKGFGGPIPIRKDLVGFILDRKDTRTVFHHARALRKETDASLNSFLVPTPVAYIGALYQQS
jgi:hypothetical protein